ncbi:MAG: TonB family protein [Acidobacteria bacterium]|nr:TonB family protein [Acidobacteriota bacterium]
MKCAEILLILEDYTYGELPDIDSIGVAAHLRDCSSCLEKYELVLKENETFADYFTDIEVNPKLWANVQKCISSELELEDLKNTNSFPQNQTISLIKPVFLEFSEPQALWKRLVTVLDTTLSDFSSNPKLFFQNLFQEDRLLTRDKKYWRVGRNIATFLWLFSLISYVSVIENLPKSFYQKEEVEKIVDLAPLTFPKNLTSKENQPSQNNSNKNSIILSESNTYKGSSSSLTNQEPKNTVSNRYSFPNISMPKDLPDSNLPSLTFGITNDNGANNGSSDIAGSKDGKGKSGLGENQSIVQGSENGYGLGTGQGPQLLEGDIIYNANDTNIIPVRVLSKEKPRYTEEARQKQIEGKVILLVIFNKNGAVTNIQVISSLGYGLDEEAIKTASQVKFLPATKNGLNVSVRARLEYTFTLF